MRRRPCRWWWSIPARCATSPKPPAAVRQAHQAKTDALDAQVLAHFAEAVRPPVRPLPDSDTQELHSLTARRSQVVAMLVAEKNRLGRASRAVAPRIQAHIRWQEQELDDLDQGLRQTQRRSPAWREKMTCCAPFPAWGNNSP